MTFESPIARAVFVYWVFVVIAWWFPGFYRIHFGRPGELGRTWRAHQAEFEEFLDSDDPEAQQYAHLLRTPMLLTVRVTVSVGWPFLMGVYFYHFGKKCFRLRRLRRHRARR